MKEYTLDEGVWYHSYPEMDKKGNEKIEEEIVEIIDVPVEVLLLEWENLVSELWEKESKLVLLKKKFNRKEFEIVYTSDIDFKSLYDSTAEKVRKQHAKSVLKDLDVEIQALELSINWIKGYIPLLRECIKTKRE